MAVDHDALFKKLITNFFQEFMDLFLPEAHCLIDYSNLKFLSQELLTDISAGEKHYVDILAEVKIKAVSKQRQPAGGGTFEQAGLPAVGTVAGKA